MQATVLFDILAVSLSFTYADVTGTNPAKGSCLCSATSNDPLNIRSTACGAVIGSASSGVCFVYLGSKQRCTLSGTSYEFFKLSYGTQTAWAAGKYLKTGSASQCERGTAPGSFTNKCMNCICQIESDCNPNTGCRMDVGSLSCGPYQIKEAYWIDCGRPGGGWKTCANNLACAQGCVKAYMKRYGTFCTEGRTPACEDYARIHNGGPYGCRRRCTISYWNKVKACCGGQTECN